MSYFPSVSDSGPANRQQLMLSVHRADLEQHPEEVGEDARGAGAGVQLLVL